MKIGILAVQGAFIEHRKMLESLGCECVELRQKSDICYLDGLVLPGGESTVPLKEKIESGLPTFGTCAGLILLAEELSNDPNVYFGTLPVTVRRNAYGRQLGSFRADEAFGGFPSFSMTFIRAPYIEKAGKGVDVLAKVDGNIVAVRYKNMLGLSFHPEMGNDTRIHEYFLDIVRRFSIA